jgi:serpin B
MRCRIALGFVVCVAGIAGALALSGCSRDGASVAASSGSSTTMSAASADAKLAQAINGFGFELLSATAREATGNPVVSPASVHAALSMTANGATDETLEEMRRTLKVDEMSAEDANGAWQRLITKLTATTDASQTLEVANALIGRKGVEFKRPFLDANQRSFGARLSAMDFENDNVTGEVNRWVSDKTHGMIPRMLDRVESGAVLYLLNAVYFKGDWAEPFKRDTTLIREFAQADGSRVEVPMMSAGRDLPYYATEEYQATRLAYKGDRSDCFVILPQAGVGTTATLDALKRGGFQKMRQSLASTQPVEVVLGLPKLDSRFGAELSEPLKAMGMLRAFDTGNAQLGATADMGDWRLYIDAVDHKTVVKVDEEGTEAAAATNAKDYTSFMEGDPMPEIICNHPYIFAIVDRESGAMLFLGVVNDPSAK